MIWIDAAYGRKDVWPGFRSAWSAPSPFSLGWPRRRRGVSGEALRKPRRHPQPREPRSLGGDPHGRDDALLQGRKIQHRGTDPLRDGRNRLAALHPLDRARSAQRAGRRVVLFEGFHVREPRPLRPLRGSDAHGRRADVERRERPDPGLRVRDHRAGLRARPGPRAARLCLRHRRHAVRPGEARLLLRGRTHLLGRSRLLRGGRRASTSRSTSSGRAPSTSPGRSRFPSATSGSASSSSTRARSTSRGSTPGLPATGATPLCPATGRSTPTATS